MYAILFVIRYHKAHHTNGVVYIFFSLQNKQKTKKTKQTYGHVETINHTDMYHYNPTLGQYQYEFTEYM